MNISPIRKSVRRIRKFLKKSSHDPSPDKVHDLRTSARRLEVTFQAFAAGGRGGEKKKLLADLRRIRKKAGKVRDLDVFTEEALRIETKPEEQDCLLQVIEHLGVSRGKQAKKLHAAARKVRSRLRRELKRGLTRIEPVFDRKADRKGNSNGKAADDVKQTRAQALTAELQLAADLHLPVRLNRHNLHPYRLKVKELRYLLQIEDRDNEKKFREKLDQVKDAIGEWHDWEELRAIAADVLDHGAQCELLESMKATTDAKYKRALQATLELRKDYVQTPAARGAKRSGPRASLRAVKPATVAAAAPMTIAV